jgi:4-amino-4-deoxy-L-arabinose transferase-like glycosyltransferase
MKKSIKVVFQNWRRTLVSVFITALLIRVGFILTLQDGFYFPDSIVYSGAAVSLITNGELGNTYDRPPGYPVFLAAFYILFGESVLAIRLADSAVGALLAVVIALIARRIGGEVVGALAGMLWSVYPIAVFIAGLVYPETLLAALLACGVLCFFPESHKELSPKRVFLAGVLWGLAALTKPVVLATIGAVSLWVMCQSHIKRFSLIFFLFLGSAITVVPWMVRDFYVYDRLVMVEPRVIAHLPRIASDKNKVQDRKIEAILNHPGVFAKHFGSEFLHFWRLYPQRITMDWPTFREAMHAADRRVVKETVFGGNNLTKTVSILSTGPLFFFAIIGTAAMWLERERRRDLALLWATILSFAVVYSIFFAKLRYRIPIEPYIIILSAYGIKKTWDVVVERFACREQIKSTAKAEPIVAKWNFERPTSNVKRP